MIVSYNKVHVGDVLLVQLATEAIVKTELERHGDLVILKEDATGEVKGFNLFNASQYLTIEEVGNIEVTKGLVAELEEAIAKNGATVSLDVDLSPKFVVGFVKEVGDHPNADKLHICKVDVGGDEPLQIVCGAPNVAEGQHVVVAKIGAVMPSGLVIKESALRGVDSYGMMCSARELAIPNAPQVKGIMILDGDVEVGTAFKF
ncbi:YtpR family tRNA-binding protein [Rummeliibacillus sp. NPDC094406]|uniref:YtpR family tRNA-binding protein n=1 Tax=Rummeliibacillus sp. NPDC094406 TaxID=3364511 RepID=UPI003821F801